MEKEYKISWLKVIIIILLVILIIGVVYLAFFKKDNTKLSTDQAFLTNINLMKEAGFEYFQGSNLPTTIGESNEISLKSLFSTKIIQEFTDENGKSCNVDESYIRATKTLDNEYALKVNLVCNNKSDYIVTNITDDHFNYESNPNTSTSDTINNYYTNNYESSGSNYSNLSSNNSNTSSTPKKEVNKKVTYNITYVNGCDCKTSSNCCSANVYYSVYYETNGGNYLAKELVKENAKAPYKTPVRDGYKFLGWYKDRNLTKPYDFDTPVTGTLTLYAKWENISNKYTVEFNSNGGSNVKDQTVEEGKTVNRPSNPTRDGYKFLGWYYNGKPFDFNTEIHHDYTLEARWEKINNKYTVKFDSKGGTSVSDKTVEEGKTVNRPSNPTRNGYKFLGWYYNGEPFDFNTKIYHDYTLEAKWEKINNKYTVKFDSKGGTSVSDKTVDEGKTVSKPNNPTRNGYKFLGWYYNGEPFDFNTKIYHDYTLEARWEKEELKYNTYCAIKTDTYYSIGYVSNKKNVWNYNWTIKFDNIHNATNVKITAMDHLRTLTDYNNAYNKVYSNKGLSMVNGNNKYSVDFTSGQMLQTYSLKASNFNMGLSDPYYSGGSWYTKANVDIYNYNNLTSYYSSKIGSSIYFVPFYFKVKYTDQSNCVDDLDSNRSKYQNYEITKTYYR